MKVYILIKLRFDEKEIVSVYKEQKLALDELVRLTEECSDGYEYELKTEKIIKK